MTARSDILAVLRQNTESLAEEVRSFPEGWAVRTRSLPMVWTLNQVHVREPIAFHEAVALADEHQHDLPYRHLVVEDPATAAGAREALDAGSWSGQREVLMALEGGAGRSVDSSPVEEISEEEMLALMWRWTCEELPKIGAEELAQLAEYHRREGRHWKEQRFGVREGGRALAVTKLRAVGSCHWVEDVYTLPEARRRGYARRLVCHAADVARKAGGSLVFIVADEDDWPKQLYARLGFQAAGTTSTFHRRVAPPG